MSKLINFDFAIKYLLKDKGKLSMLKMTVDMRDAYWNYRKTIVTYNDAMESAETKGGVKVKNEVIKRMLAKNKSLEKIADLIGFSVAENTRFLS